jgi:uncharacterized protein (TIGR01370 family)
MTLWSTGQAQPLVSTLNSLDGRIKSNAAIVPAGTSGAVSVYATDATNVILDINGYFVPTTVSTALAFYPVTPCRVADTRNASGALGGPSLVGGQVRSFPVLSACGIPSSAQAYSLNFTAIPQGPLGYLSVWPAGQSQPLVSTLNAPTGTVTANAAIVPAGTNGAIDLYTTNNADMVIDVNGYFAPPATGGLSLYTLTPCRVLDTRQSGSGQPFSGELDVNVNGSGCIARFAPQAYVFNTTVVPSGSLGYLSEWPQGTTQPAVSTLNAADGSITSNMAIVPTSNGSISAFATNPTQLIFDTSGYFAPPSAPPNNVALSKVRSFEFLAAANAGTPGIFTAIANSPSDLILLGNGADNLPLNRGVANPTGSKLIFGYVDVAEAASYAEPDLFSNGVPSWSGIGNPIPGFTNLYSVQYWNPAWEQELFAQVDELIADGYDGIFLDVLSGDNDWLQGNKLGNPVYGNATQALTTLLFDIRIHVNEDNPSRPFFLMGNNPTNIGADYPNSLENLDAILNEWIYYEASSSNAATSVYEGIAEAQYISSTLGPIYNSANIPVFGNDYPLPLTNLSADFMSFEFYTALGWVPSVTTSFQSAQILSTGPFMFMATPSNPTVTGTGTFVNFLSGGLTTAATLIGGNQGDYFIGGPGHNTITASAGDDTIYAHPASAGFKNILDFQFAATNMNATTPSISILINGQIVVHPTPITAAYATGVQDFQVNVTSFGTIASLEILVTGTSYTNQSNFSNVEIIGITYNSQAIPLSSGTYSSGNSTPGFTYSNNGSVVFPASDFQGESPFLADTSDTIDGGGGTNMVIYRGPYSNYTVAKQADGSYLVTSNSTAEGPDTLTNIQIIQFSDQSINASPIPVTYAIGGVVTGLNSGQQLILSDNGSNSLTVTQNGDFTFSVPVASNGSFAVTVSTQPTTETCTVSNGAGTNITNNISTVQVACVAATFTYTYTGQPYNPNPPTSCSGTYIPVCSQIGVSGSFTTATRLGDNLNNYTFTPETFSFSGGTNAFTLTQTSLLSIDSVKVSTDANGNIISWGIELSTSAADCTVNSVCLGTYSNVNGSGDYSAYNFNNGTPSQVYGGGSNSGTPGTWVESISVAESSSVGMLRRLASQKP